MHAREYALCKGKTIFASGGGQRNLGAEKEKPQTKQEKKPTRNNQITLLYCTVQ
jgi:hypothetical protein